MLTTGEIKNYSLFAGLEGRDLEKIAKFCTRKVYPANTLLYSPETKASYVYLLEEGEGAVQMVIPADKGKPEIIMTTLSKGATFGFAPLCTAFVRIAITRIVAQVTLIQVDGSELLRLFEQDTRLGYRVMRNLSGIISVLLGNTMVFLRQEIWKRS
jgi:CRP-like cAMP-binding protein